MAGKLGGWTARVVLIAVMVGGFSQLSTLKPGGGQLAPEPAYFVFDYPPYPQRFVFRLDDPAKIQQARAMLSGEQPLRHILGQVVKQPAAYNPPWSYHLEPDSVAFFDFAIEVCDASIQGVEDNLEQVCGSFLPSCTWCPWASRLLGEVTGGIVWPGGEVFLPLVQTRPE